LGDLIAEKRLLSQEYTADVLESSLSDLEGPLPLQLTLMKRDTFDGHMRVLLFVTTEFQLPFSVTFKLLRVAKRPSILSQPEFLTFGCEFAI